MEDWKGSRFWALSSSEEESSDDGDDTSEVDSMDTLEFSRQATLAGFTLSELEAAGNEATSTCYAKLEERSMAKKIVDTLVRKKSKVEPWLGRLPQPRRSPRMTLAATMEKAKVIPSHTRSFFSKKPSHTQSSEWSL